MLQAERECHYPELRKQGYRVTSEDTVNKLVRYNCVAWAADGDDEIWWEPIKEPGFYWPKGISDDGTLESYVEIFKLLGYKKCDSERFEFFHERIILYGYPEGSFSHVAYQLYTGWTSKLGDWQDIKHKTSEGLEGDYCGQVEIVMKRRCGFRGFLARAFPNFIFWIWPVRWRKIHEPA